MISVVVNTRNEVGRIEKCLTSVKNQKVGEAIEMIVVDNHSRDETAASAMRLGAVVFDRGPERSEQKNFGAQKAAGEWLLFLDADMELSENVAAECLEEERRGFLALVIPELSRGAGFWAECRALEKRLYFNDPLVEAPRFFKKDLFLSLGGYSPGMVSGEDWDLRNRLVRQGIKIGRINSVVYHNEGRLTLAAIVKKKFYYASKSKEFLVKNRPGIRSLVVFIFRPAFARNFRYAATDPLHFFGVLFLKSLEFTAGFAGFIYSRFL